LSARDEEALRYLWFGEDGPTWIEAVDTLEIAKAHIEKLPLANSGSYAILDPRTGSRISLKAKKFKAANLKLDGREVKVLTLLYAAKSFGCRR
jgi:hypothetical protein